MYMGISWIRYAYEHFKSILHNLDLVKLISNYYKFFYQNSKINYIIFRELLSLFLKINIKLKLWKKNQNIFVDFIRSRVPLFFKLKNNFIFGFSQLKKSIPVFNIYIKWFKNVKIMSHFDLFSLEKECIYDYLFLFETSYNTFIRSRKVKLKLYNKLIRDEKLSGNRISIILRMSKFIAQQWPRYPRPNLIAIQICKKILAKKLIFNSLIIHLTVKKDKILKLMKKQTNIRIQNLSILFNKAENFFEKKKSIGFLRLIFFPFIEFQLKNFYLDKTFSSRKNKIFSHTHTTRYIERSYNKSSLVFQSLTKKIFFYAFLTPAFFLSSKIKMLVMNFFYFRRSSNDTKLILLLLALRRKKYDLVYFYCRFLCLQKPAHLFFWYIFSKVGKKIKSINPKTLRFILRLLTKCPKSIPAIIFAANYCSIFKSHDYSLAELFQIYRWKKDSPYLFFLIFLQYLYKSLNRKNKNPEHSVVIGLCFFYNYTAIRSFSAETILKRLKKSIPLKMEIFFNKAIFYLFLKFKYLALVTLKRVLNQKNRNMTISKLNRFFNLNVIRNLETNSLFNIQLICMNKGNKLLPNNMVRIDQMKF
ncbi:TATA binding protein of transcription factor IIIC (nucleomorph) [Cryptomonas paramecium]|uniref:TATA binding protein of transcription factor IIIC n=1 Tax=Cryptomonas paramaecium TaxID=2898 RepID=F2HH82_9CRYP|nr:TATA binding protein of transcription factor IIIC [Cryptomonas paramecium]AEA38678.1 TATA binding protein of transcription factor IIIC [Cryptomonas paramecium]